MPENITPIEKEDPLTKCSSRSLIFKNEYFPSCSLSEWNDWNWQIKNSLTNKESLEKILILSKDEKNAFINKLPFRITPYYLSIIQNHIDLRKTIIPTINENIYSKDEYEDPLDEETYRHGNVIHKYKDRALFLSTNFCSTYCRYCTRSRIINKDQIDWESGFNYIKDHKEIRDVIISGGDVITLSDEKIDYILSRLKEIEHIEIIRIGSRVPIVLPMRITDSLISILKKYQPLYINIHVVNNNELTLESKSVINKLVDSGIVLGSQTVLLSTINDNIEVLKNTMKELLKNRVKPYYLYSCDKILGSSHFRVPIEDGKELVKELRNQISGMGVPQFIIDTKVKKVPVIGEYKEDLENY